MGGRLDLKTEGLDADMESRVGGMEGYDTGGHRHNFSLSLLSREDEDSHLAGQYRSQIPPTAIIQITTVLAIDIRE